MAKTQINLGAPVRGDWEGRGFGRRFVWVYRCAAGHSVRVNCSAWRGRQPDTAPGAIVCPQCDREPEPAQVPTEAVFLSSLY